MSKKNWVSLGFILIVFIVLSACGNQQETTSGIESQTTVPKDTAKLKIFTTLYPLEDFAKKIGGDYVEVESILPPGSDAHSYEPTSKEMINIAEADAFIYNGLGLESYAEKITEALKNEETLMIEATNGVDAINHSHQGHNEENADSHHEEAATLKGDEQHEHESENENEHQHTVEPLTSSNHRLEEEHEHGDFDPHVWLDPSRAIIMAENIKNALIELKPDGKEAFENNFESLVERLEELDQKFKVLVESKKDPQMIVSHAGYGYWEERYGIKQIAVSGLSPTNEPSQKDLEAIIKIATENQIKYVIFEQNITPKIAEVIQYEINAEPLRLHNLAVLTDEDIQNNEDYFSLMEKNLEILDIALK